MREILLDGRKVAGVLRDRMRGFAVKRLRARRAMVRRGLSLPPCPSRRRLGGSVWAVTMTKNEEDVIESTLTHLLAQGVAGVLVSDNMSTDSTQTIVREMAKDCPIYLATDSEPAYYQSDKMELLARWAGSAGADWIIPFDADEFWFAQSGSLASWLRSSKASVVTAAIHNVFPSERSETGWIMDTTSHHLAKVAYRAWPWAMLEMGNHDVRRPGRRSDGLTIAHVPWRSLEQLDRKLRLGGAALAHTDFDGRTGEHWREGAKRGADELANAWSALREGSAPEWLAWRPVGRVVEVPSALPHSWQPQDYLGNQ